MKGTFRIGGAALFGVLIILGAFSMRDRVAISGNEAVVVAVAPERKAIGLHDENENGVADWEESLEIQVINTLASSTTGEAYEPPSTFTGKFSEAFVQDYLQGKMGGADFSDPSVLVGGAVKAIDANTRSKEYSRADIPAFVPNSKESFHEYGNQVTAIIFAYSTANEKEADILQRALVENNETLLEALIPIEAAYGKFISESLRIEVPEGLTNEHLALLNAYERIHFDISAMRLAFSDPLFALARVRGYEDDVRAMVAAFQGIARELKGAGVEYESREPGVFLSRFKI